MRGMNGRDAASLRFGLALARAEAPPDYGRLIELVRAEGLALDPDPFNAALVMGATEAWAYAYARALPQATDSAAACRQATQQEGTEGESDLARVPVARG